MRVTSTDNWSIIETSRLSSLWAQEGEYMMHDSWQGCWILHWVVYATLTFETKFLHFGGITPLKVLKIAFDLQNKSNFLIH